MDGQYKCWDGSRSVRRRSCWTTGVQASGFLLTVGLSMGSRSTVVLCLAGRSLSPRRSDRTPKPFAIVPLRDGTRGVAIGTTESGNDRLLFFKHDGEFVEGWPQFLGDFRVEPVAAGDLDGDGEPELVVGDTTDVWAFHLDGTVVEGWPQSIPEVGNHSQPLIADVTEDGRPDVLVFALGLSMWHLYAWESDGTLIDGFPFTPSSTIALTALQGATLGDLNDDGLLDFAMASEGNGDLRRPGRVHVFTFNTKVDESTMHWPTQGHDYQRTSTWPPPHASVRWQWKGSTASYPARDVSS